MELQKGQNSGKRRDSKSGIDLVGKLDYMMEVRWAQLMGSGKDVLMGSEWGPMRALKSGSWRERRMDRLKGQMKETLMVYESVHEKGQWKDYLKDLLWDIQLV